MLQLAALLILSVCPSAWAQQKDFSGAELLRHALHLADLYNWTDAAPEFRKAEQIFSVAGDQRNALFARLGKIRSTIEQQVLPVASADLAHELETNALLQNDDQLRMFAWMVKGDVDGETNATAMREDWEQVQALARSLGDTKWQYRSLAQLGVAAYYEKSDVETARKNVGSALAAATSAGDAGAQIRLLTVLGIGLAQARMYEQALPLFDKALMISSATPDSGYPFMTNEARLDALIGMGQTDLAQHLADDILTHARPKHPNHEAVVLTIVARIARARKDDQAAVSALEQSIALSKAGGFLRLLGDEQALLAEMYREKKDLEKAEELAELAAVSTQESGDTWSLPQRLELLAELHTSRGKFSDADRAFDRAEAFVDSLIGNASSVLDKTLLSDAIPGLLLPSSSHVAHLCT